MGAWTRIEPGVRRARWTDWFSQLRRESAGLEQMGIEDERMRDGIAVIVAGEDIRNGHESLAQDVVRILLREDIRGECEGGECEDDVFQIDSDFDTGCESRVHT